MVAGKPVAASKRGRSHGHPLARRIGWPYHYANMLPLLHTQRDLFDVFAPSIRTLPERERLSKEDLLHSGFLLHQDERLAVYYAPFDHVNERARIAVVGITPGWNQMEIAHRSASRDLRDGLAPGEVLRRAKQRASFAGSMRKNLVSMLDDLKLPAYLGIGSTETLFDEDRPLLHTTSTIRYPVFVKGRNYTGHSPKPLKAPTLRFFVEDVLAKELQAVPDAIIVPLGKSVSEALDHLADAAQLDRNRCLWGFPHPSGANVHRAREFLERREGLERRLREWLG